MGLRVSAVNLEGATSLIFAAIAAGRREYVCIRDAHGVIRAQEDPHLRDAHNEAFLVTPDGMPLVWALHRAGYRNAGRVYGPDLMLRIFDAGRERRLRHFLYGSTPEVLEGLQKRLRARFPGAIIARTFAPPFRQLDQDEETAVAECINRSRADVLWVGLGTPKQELWMQRMRGRLEPAMLIGVGAAFDFHAGRIRQAPKILQRNGLEFRRKRHRLTPGLTGLWQVSARGDADVELQQRLDEFYIDNKSFWLDLHIVLSTLRAVFNRSGAY